MPHRPWLDPSWPANRPKPGMPFAEFYRRWPAQTKFAFQVQVLRLYADLEVGEDVDPRLSVTEHYLDPGRHAEHRVYDHGWHVHAPTNFLNVDCIDEYINTLIQAADFLKSTIAAEAAAKTKNAATERKI